ncbi:MAG: SDR family NAD(P)-dependent oxidoreductase [Nitrospirota bacterium]|nr:SDR family NAD(P)-dependent oxidoreductase [Nitrospirota bacterium]
MAIFEDHNKPLRDHPDQTTCPTILVMGGSGVIGNAICSRFTEANWLVGVHYNQHQSYAQKTCSQLPQNQNNQALFQADVRNPIEVQRMVDQFINQWGKLDVFVWAVGQTSDTITRRLTTEQWDNVIQTNLTGLFYCLQALGPIFQNQQTGSVLIVSSLASLQGTTGQTGYAASKAGVLGLMRSVAQEWGPSNIRVNAVFPGWHQSPLSGDAFPDPNSCPDHLLGHTPNLQATANLIFYLATAQDISGQIFNLDNRIG